MMAKYHLYLQRFQAQLVMKDESTSKIKHSKKHGEIVLDVQKQVLHFSYPKVARIFLRKFEQPSKCLMGRQILKIYSGNGKKSFICRFLSVKDTRKCVGFLKEMGVEIVNINNETKDHDEGYQQLFHLLNDPEQYKMLKDFVFEYVNSSMLEKDIESILASGDIAR